MSYCKYGQFLLIIGKQPILDGHQGQSAVKKEGRHVAQARFNGHELGLAEVGGRCVVAKARLIFPRGHAKIILDDTGVGL